jgi:NAD(P)-dependent dehydrogenase (short-subunit alcohol dehydrogenase family)
MMPGVINIGQGDSVIEFNGRKVVVTGGAGILGQAVASRVKALGGTPVMLDIVDGFISDLGPTHSVDLTDATAVEACIAGIGKFDSLCNIAGGFDMGPAVFETTDALWDRMFLINVTTLRRMLAAAVPVLRAAGGGSIVNVGAFGALKGQGAMGAYGAAKSTVMRLTESLSEEVKGENINVNAVLPTLIDTPTNRADLPDSDFSKWVSPDKLANVICFLASDAASDVHGALVPVTGKV